MPRHARKPTWTRRAPWVAGAVATAVLALLTASWALDTALASGEVVRNVEVAGTPVGGMDEDTLAGVLDELAADVAAAPVRIEAEGVTYESTAGDLGVSVDGGATAAAILDAGRDGLWPARPFVWARALLSPHTVELRYAVDEARLAVRVAELEGANRTAPIEPALLAGDDGTITVSPGVPGRGIDPGLLVPRLLDALVAAEHPSPDTPVALAAEVTDLAPRYSDAEAEEIAREADRLARQPLFVTFAGETRELPRPMVATWLRATPGPDGSLTVAIDPEAAGAGLGEVFAGVGEPPVDASFTIEGGVPVLHPSRAGTGCCAPEAAAQVLAALQGGVDGIEVDMVVREPELTTEEARSYGIVEEVGRPDEFGPTTRHACCEPRVQNIHRIADLIQGVVIPPGGVFSVNEHVGQRTRAKGFVEAPVIYEGRMDMDVGGGVSQFATTLFNAAFFAGLDLVEYQSHTLVISRYPRGREATISYPKPDLVISNPSPYGILLWPTYTDTSITVHVYSTHWVEVEAGPTRDSSAGVCTRVVTPRTRRFVDGTVSEDTVAALYQPREGVRC